ncbi:MAG: hypothetical protein IKA76_01950 [Clostridia bacterium]|nr:hypothetical protein [Clostridia bacterium]
MTEKECKQILREDILPVILGNSLTAHRLSLHLFIRYGLSSLVCAEHRGCLGALNPFAGFFPLTEGSSRLLCEQLEALAERYEGCQLLLIPSSPSERARLEACAPSLESTYFLIDPEDLDTWLLPCAR